MTLPGLVHASNTDATGSEAAARLLHDVLEMIVGAHDANGLSGDDIVSVAWEYLSYLRLPQVVWGIGDALQLKPPRGRMRHRLLLPTTTQLSTSAKVVSKAKDVFGLEPFAELKTHAFLATGSIHRTELPHSASFHSIDHLVCRQTGSSKLLALGDCLKSVEARPFDRFVLPLWGDDADVDGWASAIARWVSAPRSIQDGRVSLLVRILPADMARGSRLEHLLIRSGVLVGREDECVHYDPNYHSFIADTSGLLAVQGDIKSRLATLVSASGPLKPDSYAYRLHSGISLSVAAWDRHVRALLT